MKLISLPICPYVQQVRALMEVKQVSYEVEHIAMRTRPDWLMAASPDGGEVPVLITDEGQALFQSDSIIEYLDETYGNPLLSGSPLAKARDRAWGFLASENYLLQCSAQRSPDEMALRAQLDDLAPIFSHMEASLTGDPFFHGGRLSMVDVSWLPLLHRSALIEIHTGYDFLAPYPRLGEWRRAMLETGLAEASVTDDFERVFTDFYLSDETYLGRLARGGVGACVTGTPQSCATSVEPGESCCSCT